MGVNVVACEIRFRRNVVLSDPATNRHEDCRLVGTLSKGKKYGLLIRCEEAVDEEIGRASCRERV